MKTKQSGFTLVEIAIVLVIIGLLLGGVLKGQSLIDNARIKNTINDLKAVQSAYYSYIDRYKAVPGDDILASTRLTLNGAAVTNGGGNGVITGVYSTAGACGALLESNNFWQHTRAAGLLTGDSVTNGGCNPGVNAVGGFLGIQSQVSAAGGLTYGMTGPVACSGSIPSNLAQSADSQIDDGTATTGSFRAGGAGTNLATTVGGIAYVAGATTTHTVCMQI